MKKFIIITLLALPIISLASWYDFLNPLTWIDKQEKISEKQTFGGTYCFPNQGCLGTSTPPWIFSTFIICFFKGFSKYFGSSFFSSSLLKKPENPPLNKSDIAIIDLRVLSIYKYYPLMLLWV